jgi:hypothetical protein
MKRTFLNTGTAVANNGGAMEQRPFEKRASLKSQMSKENNLNLIS